MDFGVVMFPTDSFDASRRVRPTPGRARLRVGLVSRAHPHPGQAPQPVAGRRQSPREYWSGHDPFVALTVAATATTRLRLGTGICLVIERDPIITAKEAASLDRLSGGRFLFGIGGGWNVEEMENHGTEFKKRWRE